MTFQERYLAHQKRKKATLIEIIKSRHSNRMFGDGDVDPKIVSDICAYEGLLPSSCDRHAVTPHIVNSRDEKSLLGGLLVGGVGWIHRAHTIFLLFADPEAYKAGNEIEYMPYLDAGIVVYYMYLKATEHNLHACFCNPNIREMNKSHFKNIFGDKIFCGAFAIGNKI